MEDDPIEVVLDVLERHDNRILTADIAALTDSERVVRVIWEVDAQVKNGGFLQYFANPSGENVPHIVDAFAAIGDAEVVALIEQALAVFPDDVRWGDYLHRSDCLDGLQPASLELLDSLSFRYYEYADEVMVLLNSFIQAHAPDIAGQTLH